MVWSKQTNHNTFQIYVHFYNSESINIISINTFVPSSRWNMSPKKVSSLCSELLLGSARKLTNFFKKSMFHLDSFKNSWPVKPVYMSWAGASSQETQLILQIYTTKKTVFLGCQIEFLSNREINYPVPRWSLTPKSIHA